MLLSHSDIFLPTCALLDTYQCDFFGGIYYAEVSESGQKALSVVRKCYNPFCHLQAYQPSRFMESLSFRFDGFRVGR